jgi:hypothetical protein
MSTNGKKSRKVRVKLFLSISRSVTRMSQFRVHEKRRNDQP